MFIIFTAPLTLFVLNVVAIGLTRFIYQVLLSSQRRDFAQTPGFWQLFLETGAFQLVYLLLYILADAVIDFEMSRNEWALSIMLLTAFIFPPLLAIWHWRASNHQ